MGNCISTKKKLYCQICFGPFLHRSCLKCETCNINFHYSCLYKNINTLDICIFCRTPIKTRYLEMNNNQY